MPALQPEALFPGLGLLTAAIGWPLASRRIPPNRWYGLRIPATLADKTVWYDANAGCGRDMIICGVGLILLSLVLHVLGVTEPAYALVCTGVFVVWITVIMTRWTRRAILMLEERQGLGSAGGES